MTVSVRYIVADVDEAIEFYTKRLGFAIEMHPAPGFAMLSRGDLRLLLNVPTGPGGAAQPMGGNQILLEDPSGNPVELFEPPKSA
jgi:catechol-2,3-dioxygenase